LFFLTKSISKTNAIALVINPNQFGKYRFIPIAKPVNTGGIPYAND